jgi:hypothetical protein
MFLNRLTRPRRYAVAGSCEHSAKVIGGILSSKGISHAQSQSHVTTDDQSVSPSWF